MARPRFCLPYLFSHETSEGPWEELTRYGASPLRCADDLLAVLREAGPYDNPRWWASEEKLKAEAKQVEEVREQKEGKRKGESGALTVERSRRAKASSRMKALAVPQGPEDVPMSPVTQAISRGFGTIEAICLETGENPAEVQHQVHLLTLEGRVFEDDAGVLRYHPPGNARS
jgi:predicted Rossmann fold nucleotide-binding protein DprA/Smf involved in DNA uptake